MCVCVAVCVKCTGVLQNGKWWLFDKVRAYDLRMEVGKVASYKEVVRGQNRKALHILLTSDVSK